MALRKLLKKGFVGALALSTIVCLANPTSVDAASWKKNHIGWWYQEDNGSWPANAWKKVNGSWYWFDQNGYMATGWQNVGGKWYYLQPSGAMLGKGWHWIGDKCYYMYDSGAMAANTWIGNDYVDGSGKWVPEKTKAQAKWVQSGNRWWYRHSDGSYTKNGWELINGQWYHFDSAGWMQTGWQNVGGKWYYLQPSGAMLGKGWHWIGDKCYYMYDSGAMAANTWIGNDYVDGSGKWVPEKTKAQAKWVQSGNRWWYRHSDGSYTKNGWELINGQWYYFDGAGWMVSNRWIGDYYVTASGAMATNTWIGNYYVDGSGKWVPNAQKNQHKHTWVIKEYKEEGHYENGKLISPEEGHNEIIHHDAVTEQQWVVDKEAWTETIEHPAEYKTVHHEAEYKTVHHEEEGEWRIVTRCHNCGADLSGGKAVQHIKENFMNGCLSYGDFEEWVVTKEAWDEQVLVKEAWDEQVKVKDAWTETIEHPEQGHYETVVVKEAWDEEKWVVDKPAVYEQVWVVDKEGWTETICSDCGKKK